MATAEEEPPITIIMTAAARQTKKSEAREALDTQGGERGCAREYVRQGRKEEAGGRTSPPARAPQSRCPLPAARCPPRALPAEPAARLEARGTAQVSSSRRKRAPIMVAASSRIAVTAPCSAAAVPACRAAAASPAECRRKEPDQKQHAMRNSQTCRVPRVQRKTKECA